MGVTGSHQSANDSVMGHQQCRFMLDLLRIHSHSNEEITQYQSDYKSSVNGAWRLGPLASLNGKYVTRQLNTWLKSAVLLYIQ
jgi:hypothetical protein